MIYGEALNEDDIKWAKAFAAEMYSDGPVVLIYLLPSEQRGVQVGNGYLVTSRRNLAYASALSRYRQKLPCSGSDAWLPVAFASWVLNGKPSAIEYKNGTSNLGNFGWVRRSTPTKALWYGSEIIAYIQGGQDLNHLVPVS